MKTIFFCFPTKYPRSFCSRRLILMTAPSMWIKRSLVMVMVSPSSAGADCVSAWGRLTPIPDCIIGAVTMKMTRRTSMTSIKGVTLISERDVPILPLLDRDRDCGLSAIESVGDIQEFQGEIFHLGDQVLDPVEEMIVGDDRRDGGEKHYGRSDQGFGDAGRHGHQAGRPDDADLEEGVHDAPDSAEEADERRDAARRSQEAHLLFQPRNLGIRCLGQD